MTGTQTEEAAGSTEPVWRAIRSRVVTSAARALARTTPWMERELAELRPVVPVGGTCIDVGAAAGFYTAELSRLVGPTGLVVSVEPLPFAHVATSRVLGLRQGGNVRCHRVAMGRESCRATISVPLRNGQFITGRSFVTRGAHGLGSNAEFDDHAEFVVAVEMIDRLVQAEGLDRLDFIKIDVEGAELDALAGAEETLERFRPAVLLEIEERHLRRFDRTPATVVQWMSERGYHMLAWRGHRWTPTNVVTDEVATRNYLFVRR